MSTPSRINMPTVVEEQRAKLRRRSHYFVMRSAQACENAIDRCGGAAHTCVSEWQGRRSAHQPGGCSDRAHQHARPQRSAHGHSAGLRPKDTLRGEHELQQGVHRHLQSHVACTL